MSLLDLSSDELLSTTRTVRKRLDLTRPVEREVIEECIDLALQAPNGSNRQPWHFIVVTDAEKRAALADLYRQGYYPYRAARNTGQPVPDERRRIASSSDYLAEHMHEVPVLVVPAIEGRTDEAPIVQQAGTWGSVLPATWSFMLAARARGLGTAWTTLHLVHEREAAEVLGIPYDRIMQAALIPVAYTIGTDFRRGPRVPDDDLVHWERW
jgi:nitroreductase